MLGTLLGGRYQIITILGAGGFGQTYLAEDTELPRQCVVKQFKPMSQDAKFLVVARRLFETEVDTLRRLGEHDQIPDFYDAFDEEDEFYLVQEFIEGQSLSDELHRRSTLDEESAIALLKDLLTVLQFVHQSHVIHRDIKPGNLIRRQQDGKIVLIDFGAVKELHTQMTLPPGQTVLTVGIGTQGYTPPEQLMGKPRYCSDIYALGMTLIQAVTGLQPAYLSEDPSPSEIRWQDRASISMGLKFILDRMVRPDHRLRYQSAEDVLKALQTLSELPTNATDIPTHLLLPESLRNLTQPFEPQHWRDRLKAGLWVGTIATLATTTLLLGIRQLGWLEPLELAAYDQITRLQPAQPPDPRLLVVGITETDLQTLQRPTPSDATLAEAIAKLQQASPRVIGLDLHRDLPQEPGRAALLQQLQKPNVVSITKLGTSPASRIPPPPGISPDQIGFSDLAVDPDNVVRRNLMFGSTEQETLLSFSLRLSLNYLAAQGVKLPEKPAVPGVFQIGSVLFPPLAPTSGGYQNADANGYQVMLRYRSPDTLARQVTLTEVLQNQVPPEWVKDKMVLIGTVAPSGKDLFYTPFSASERTDHQMPGVVVHGQQASQILSTVLDGQSLIWYLPDWGEALWIVGWALLGSGLAWVIRHPLVLGLGGVAALGVLGGTTVLVFTQQGWLPVAAPSIALLLSTTGVALYRSYHDQNEQQEKTRLLLSDNPTLPLHHR